jgi:hypothetical protein
MPISISFSPYYSLHPEDGNSKVFQNVGVTTQKTSTGILTALITSNIAQ